MKKFDYSKEYKDLFKPSKTKVSVVNVPAMNFLQINGKGDPNNSLPFSQGIEALYGLSYSIKFRVREQKNIDYRVFPLEGLWWSDNMDDFLTGNKQNWQWTIMIAQPEWVIQATVDEQMEAVASKKDLPALSKIRFVKFKEGKSAQILHIGPFSEEGPNIRKVHYHIEAIGGTRQGLHHEIYLSDTRRSKPENWRTIIRQPFK